MLDIVQIPVLQDNYVYLVHEPSSGQTAVVDPAVAEPVLQAAEQRQWTISHILNTHHHGDHVGGNAKIQAATGCAIVGNIHDKARIPGLSIGVTHNDTVSLGAVTFCVLDVPGHTTGHIAFVCADPAVLFCGDTLFAMGCGRLFEGTPEQMWHSLQRIRTLPPETQVYCAHEYTLANAAFALSVDQDNLDLKNRVADVNALREQGKPTVPFTLAVDQKTNPFLRADATSLASAMGTAPGAETFAAIRKRKDNF